MGLSDFYVQDSSDIENKVFEAARNHFKNAKYSEALKLYLGMLNTSISYKLYYEIGRCYYKLNDLLPAEEFFRKSIALDSTNNLAFLYLGNINYKRSDLKNAIENWAKVFAFRPYDEAVCLNLANAYFNKDMKFQSVFYYEKYLKYAKVKNSSYEVIKTSIDKCNQLGEELLQKARGLVANGQFDAAISDLTFATKNVPVSFDINHFLGKLYLQKNDYMHSLIYLKQALCLDNKSLDVLQNLATVYSNLGDYTATYCTLRRLLPLIIHNQTEYLKTVKLIKQLKDSFDTLSYKGHLDWAINYDEDNNYHMALIEYENVVILNSSEQNKYSERIEEIKSFINPEEKVIKTCMEKGGILYEEKDYKASNKYFTRVMEMSNKNSPEYKLAKSRVINV